MSNCLESVECAQGEEPDGFAEENLAGLYYSLVTKVNNNVIENTHWQDVALIGHHETIISPPSKDTTTASAGENTRETQRGIQQNIPLILVKIVKVLANEESLGKCQSQEGPRK